MYALLFVALTAPAFMGDYRDLAACQAAVREIYAQRINPPGQRMKELDQSIDLTVRTSKEYLCVKKG